MKQHLTTENTITFFGKEDPLSNFHHVKNGFELDGYRFFNSESAFMYRKALMFNDQDAIKALTTNKPIAPYTAKKIGRSVKNYDEAIWSAIRENMMLHVLFAKFQDPELKSVLLKTSHKTIIEASPYDKIWGAGLDATTLKANGFKYNGQNLLGKLLMYLRFELRKNESHLTHIYSNNENSTDNQ